MSDYKILLFDVDETLLDFKKAESRALRTVLVRNGIPDDDITISRYSDINLSYWKSFERGEIGREEIFPGRFGAFLNELNLALDPMEINHQYFLELQKGYDLMDGAIELLTKLNGRYSMYIITNGVAATQYSRIEGSGITPFFNKLFISEEVGAQKPAKEFFDFVLHSIGNPKLSEVLVIGDSLSGDILGGINAGIDTCWVNIRGNENDTPYEPNYEIHHLNELFTVLGE